MSFGDGMNKAGDIAKQAIELMDSHKVPPAPPNFAIWYSYVSQRYPDLKIALDQMIRDDADFDGMVNQSLYDTYLGYEKEGALLQETGAHMKEQADKMLEVIGGASSEIEGVRASIKDNLKSFSEDASITGIEAFVQNMMQETRRIQETNAQLQARLEKSSAEIETLQSNLKQAEKESYTDALTGIANRKKFDAFLKAASEMAEKDGSKLCLAVGDIDFFKKFNDTFGHQVGDQVLKLVAGALHANVKGSDLAARYGGEEFALVLPDTQIEDGFKLVDNIRDKIGSQRVRNRQAEKDFGNVTLSLGIAEFKPGEALSDFVERADAALYKSKEGGRNRTTIAE
ncbi:MULTISPECIES: GGDEF domain-containing protein [Kordiimonas]|uniref:GGDEF domain-containing protein n=1 Tax=Kordiimonas TaxID=288021 RepID=UPI001FF5EEDF|nr:MULTISPECIES: GGDEF domain-containing protein [Kordiimonas]MCK0070822.1 GGDEF domain-containing protein [Kordiimonas laminariae]UTW59331.1 diguanylate cyclase [Kordiimonas sp. SCSIO 12603]